MLASQQQQLGIRNGIPLGYTNTRLYKNWTSDRVSQWNEFFTQELRWRNKSPPTLCLPFYVRDAIPTIFHLLRSGIPKNSHLCARRKFNCFRLLAFKQIPYYCSCPCLPKKFLSEFRVISSQFLPFRMFGIFRKLITITVYIKG